MSAPSPTALQLMRAHQWLYYVANRPVISDYAYDLYCREHGMDGGGGSDLDSDYTDEDRELAQQLLAERAGEG